MRSRKFVFIFDILLVVLVNRVECCERTWVTSAEIYWHVNGYTGCGLSIVYMNTIDYSLFRIFTFISTLELLKTEFQYKNLLSIFGHFQLRTHHNTSLDLILIKQNLSSSTLFFTHCGKSLKEWHFVTK